MNLRFIETEREQVSSAGKKTGSVVAEIPCPTTGFPVTYMKAGRQYIAVAARIGDAVEVVTLALEAPASPPGRE